MKLPSVSATRVIGWVVGTAVGLAVLNKVVVPFFPQVSRLIGPKQ